MSSLASKTDAKIAEEQAWLGAVKTWQKDTKAYQEAMHSCLEKAKAKADKMKASLEEIEMEATVERKEVCNKEVNMDTFGTVKD